MFANKLCVKTFQVKNVPLTLTLSLNLKTSIVDGFLYHITEGLGVDVSLVMIRVILKKIGGIMLLQDTRKYNL